MAGKSKSSPSTEPECMSWDTCERYFELTPKTFIKRELFPSEYVTRSSGKPLKMPPNSRARLENEYRVLRFIRDNTDIPVPKPLSLREVNGALCLEVERMPGVELCELEIQGRELERVVEDVEAYLKKEVIPQLQTFTSATLGGFNRDYPMLLAHPAVTAEAKFSGRERTSWKRVTRNTRDFCLCHTDLSQANILVDPKTYEVTAIIDWEYSGFFTPRFEKPLWRHDPTWYQERSDPYNHVELAALLDKISPDT